MEDGNEKTERLRLDFLLNMLFLTITFRKLHQNHQNHTQTKRRTFSFQADFDGTSPFPGISRKELGPNFEVVPQAECCSHGCGHSRGNLAGEVETQILELKFWKRSCDPKWMLPKIGVPQNGWLIMKNPIRMDDLGVPLSLETPIYHIYSPENERISPEN